MSAPTSVTPNELRSVRNLLAVIHGDGGQYVESHGLEKACRDAEAEVISLRKIIKLLERLHDRAIDDLERKR